MPVATGLRRLLLSALLIAVAASQVTAEEQQVDPSLERIRAALSAIAVEPSVRVPVEPSSASWHGISLVPPDIGRKHFIRVRVPIGDYAMKTARAVSAARQGRAERKAREQVERDLQQFLKQKRSRYGNRLHGVGHDSHAPTSVTFM
jgi:hypothetical protein